MVQDLGSDSSSYLAPGFNNSCIEVETSAFLAVMQDLQLDIERVIGLAQPHASSVTYSPAASGDIAYPAGCFVVVYNPKKNKQTHFLCARNPSKPMHCTAFSPNGRQATSSNSQKSKQRSFSVTHCFLPLLFACPCTLKDLMPATDILYACSAERAAIIQLAPLTQPRHPSKGFIIPLTQVVRL